jgi:hypothetical protein
MAGRTIWSAALVVFRNELENAGIWICQRARLAVDDEEVRNVGGARLFRAKEGVGVSFTARARDPISGLLRGGCFAHMLVGGALRLGVLAAAIGAAALGVLLRSTSTRRASTVLRCGRRGAAR